MDPKENFLNRATTRLLNPAKNEIGRISTARKTIFSFSRHPEKMVFSKKLRWNMIFLVLSGKMIFLSPENMISPLRQKMKDDLSQKNTRNMIFSSNVLKRWSFKRSFQTSWKDGLFKKIALGHDLSWIIWKDGIFSRKNDIFSLSGKWEIIFLKKYMEILYFLCTRTGVTNAAPHPPSKKYQRMILSRKNTAKGDWRSRLTF